MNRTPQAIIFDLDGTLWDSVEGVTASWNEVMDAQPDVARHLVPDNIRLIMERNGIKDAVYVGDTQGDCDASGEAGIPFVFARYGFGKVDRYDAVIDTPAELCGLFD